MGSVNFGILNPLPAVQGAKISDPLELQAKRLALRAAGRDAKMGEIALSNAELQQSETKRAIAEGQAFRDLLRNNPNATPQEMIGVAGVKPTAEYLKVQAEQRKADLEAKLKALELNKTKAQRLGSLAGTATDDDTYQRAVGTAVSEGLIPREEAVKYLMRRWSPEVASEMKQFQLQALDADKAMDEERKALKFEWDKLAQPFVQQKTVADAERATQQAAGQSPEQLLAKKELERRAMPNTETELAVVANDPNAPPEERAKAQAAMAALTRQKIAARPVTNINSEQGKDAMEMAAQSLASGDLTRLRDIASLRGDQRLMIYARAKQLNPNFSTGEVDRKLKMEDDVTNGKTSQNLRSFNIFLQHAGEAAEATEQIRNTRSKLINKPLNWWRDNMAGSPEYSNLIAALEPVRKEFEGFLLGGRALYAEDRKAAETILSENSSPAQIEAALKRMGKTAEARLVEENYRYKKVMKRDIPDVLSPEAAAGAQRIGLNIRVGQEPQKPGGGKPPLSYFER